MRKWIRLLLPVCAMLLGCGENSSPPAVDKPNAAVSQDTTVAQPAPSREAVNDKGASAKRPPITPEQANAAAAQVLGKGGNVMVQGFSSLEAAQNFDLSAAQRLVGEPDGLRKAAGAVAAHDPAAYLFVLANARRPVKEMTDILGEPEKTSTAEERFRIPEATEEAFQPKVKVTWHEYGWLSFGSVDDKIVAARVLPKLLIDAENEAQK